MMGTAERIKELKAKENNKQIAANREAIIQALLSVKVGFIAALTSYSTTRHNTDTFPISEREETSLKLTAIEQLRKHCSLSIYSKNVLSLSIPGLVRVSPENNRRLAYVMAHLVLADYEDRVKSHPLGLETSFDELISLSAKYFDKLRALYLEHRAFTSGRSHQLKNTLRSADLGVSSQWHSVRTTLEKTMVRLTTLLSAANGRLDTYTLVRAAICSQYQSEIIRFVWARKNDQRIQTALPQSIKDFIESYPLASAEEIIDRLTLSICDNPNLAKDYELNQAHLDLQISQEEGRIPHSLSVSAGGGTGEARHASELPQPAGGAGSTSGVDIAASPATGAAPAGSPRYAMSGLGTGRPVMTASGRQAAEEVLAQHGLQQ